MPLDLAYCLRVNKNCLGDSEFSHRNHLTYWGQAQPPSWLQGSRYEARCCLGDPAPLLDILEEKLDTKDILGHPIKHT